MILIMIIMMHPPGTPGSRDCLLYVYGMFDSIPCLSVAHVFVLFI